MPLETTSRIVAELADRGYNAEREAVTLIANAGDPDATLEDVVETAPEDALRITADHVRSVTSSDPSVSTRTTADPSGESERRSPVETKGSTHGDKVDPEADRETDEFDRGREGTSIGSPGEGRTTDTASDRDSAPPGGRTVSAESPASSTDGPGPTTDGPDTATEGPNASTEAPNTPTERSTSTERSAPVERAIEIADDMTGRSTGTGEYADFVRTFRDRYERLSRLLGGRVNHRPASAIADMPGGSDAAMIGLVNDVRSTKSGHWLVELEDTTGTFPALIMKDKGIADLVDEILLDECLAIDGTLSDDAGILFADSVHFPDVPRTFQPSFADRQVQAALISDVHVGSQEFMRDAWQSFSSWLHTEEAEAIEYLLIAGDMVEGVGVYPDQDEELDIVDIYEQYERFSEHLKEVPADLEVVMIPGNHDAVRLAEPQPAFDEELRGIMSAHDSRIVSNPAMVTVENVSVLMYHGVSLDEVIAELPAEKASYDEPHRAMYQLLKKRHVAPQFGGHTRVAPEERDHLVIENVPEVFHTGHVHKLGWGKYHNVLAVNSGCWQAQTDFQRSVNIDPDAGFAPVLDLDTLEMTVHKFS
ncbi:DNA-directed DNA polymerase II small subunit [Halopenitus salinus]|uniref:DNA polymerase II small subunit n=1 Tax=Halopenitus salinus TaxID=1198295 RepID=A0ABD5UY98_9EURY